MVLYALSILLLCPLLLLPLLFFMQRKIKIARKNKQSLPPGPPKLPIIGNLHQLGALPHQSLCQLAKRYGPIMLLQLGGVPTLVISSAEAARIVLKVNDLNCCSRPPLAGARILTYNYLDIGFTPYSDYWREMKKICVLELFSTKKVQSYRSIREEEVGLLINSISQSSSSATPVDLREKLFSLTASIIFRIAFGTSFQESGFNHRRFHEVVHDAQAMLGSYSAAEFIPYVGWIIDRLSGLHQRFERTFHGLCVWSIDGWEKKKSRFIQAPPGRQSPLVGETKVQFHNDQTHVLVAHESQIAVYDCKLECLRSWYPKDALAAPISSAIYSCDGSLVYTAFCDVAVGVFDADGLRLRCRIAPSAYITSFSLSGNAVYPLVIAAHPLEPNQIALGMTDGVVCYQYFVGFSMLPIFLYIHTL